VPTVVEIDMEVEIGNMNCRLASERNAQPAMTWWAPAWAVVRVVGLRPKLGGVVACESVTSEEPYARGENRSGKVGDATYELREARLGGL
jgi:hypothetical protein